MAAGPLASLKSVVTKILCHRLVGQWIGRIYSNQIPNRGKRFFVPPQGDPKITAWLFWGIYEAAEIRLIKKHLPKNSDVVELGSSLGIVTCQIDSVLDPTRTIVAVEPNPTLLPFLRQNVEKHARRSSIVIVQGALSYSGNATIALELGNSNLTSKLGVASSERTVDVPTVTLAQLLAEHKLTSWSLVCDIEGAEAALFDNEAAVFDHCQCLIIELHHTEHRGRTFSPESLIVYIEQQTQLRMVARDGRAVVFQPQKTL